MDARLIVILMVCIAAVLIAGCTTNPALPGTATPGTTTPAVTTGPADAWRCRADTDCVPAQCCHPAGCTGRAGAPSCSAVMCTMSCEGPIDCGAGSCGCVEGRCSVIPAPGARSPAAQGTTVRIEAIPQRYSPMMSSTVGIRLTPVVTGFLPATSDVAGNMKAFAWSPVTCEWNSTFGTFLTWNAPDYMVHQIGNPAGNNCSMVYWTFIDKPASVQDPVTITVTARDVTRQDTVLGSSAVILNWDGDFAVYPGEIQ